MLPKLEVAQSRCPVPVEPPPHAGAVSLLTKRAPEMADEAPGEIQEGAAASEAFLEIIDPGTTAERRQLLRDALIASCAHDTMAVVTLARKFVSGVV